MKRPALATLPLTKTLSLVFSYKHFQAITSEYQDHYFCFIHIGKLPSTNLVKFFVSPTPLR